MHVSSYFRPRRWQWAVLGTLVLITRLGLLNRYDVELSQDGFDAVNTLAILQTRGARAVPDALLDRFILHPFYMLLLGGLRAITPASLDFYIVARLFSTVCAGVAVILMFEFARRAFGDLPAWLSALFLAFAPSFLWESVSILSSTLFLALYLAVLIALLQQHCRFAALCVYLAAITRTEGIVLLGLVFGVAAWRDLRARQIHFRDWAFCAAAAGAFALTMGVGGWLVEGNALELVGAQSMASIWLRFLAPGDFWKRAQFFLTQYPALFPAPIVWLGVAGALLTVWRHRTRATTLLFAASALYLLFFETLVWFNYTTLEVRFLMYPGLPLLVFAGIALADARVAAARFSRAGSYLAVGIVVLGLLASSYAQGDLGMQFVYKMHASQREVAAELAPLVPPHEPTNVLIYAGVSGALDYYARQRDLQLAFTYFRFAPDAAPEQYLAARQVQFVVYPVGNAFAKAKFPELAQFETQTRGAVTFQPLTQFTTTLDSQRYSIWRVIY